MIIFILKSKSNLRKFSSDILTEPYNVTFGKIKKEFCSIKFFIFYN